MERVEKTEQEWREELSPDRYHVLRKKGTEPPFTGAYTYSKADGMYRCGACGNELFSSDAKYDSASGRGSDGAGNSTSSLGRSSSISSVSFPPSSPPTESRSSSGTSKAISVARRRQMPSAPIQASNSTSPTASSTSSSAPSGRRWLPETSFESRSTASMSSVPLTLVVLTPDTRSSPSTSASSTQSSGSTPASAKVCGCP